MILIYIIAAAAVLWLLAVWPGRGRRERMEIFSKQLIAHRGLHGAEHPENTLGAFRKAVEKGYGIELDVRETKDGMLVVAHDDTLLRVAGVDRKISELSWGELQKISLFRTQEHVPSLEAALDVIDGKVPLILEIKSEERTVAPICENTVYYLDRYQGITCVESFNPLVVYWFRKNRPETLRGQLASKFTEKDAPSGLSAFLFGCCFFNFLTRPDFIAYNWQYAHLMRFQLLRGIYGAVAAAWTVRSPETLKAQAQNFDIFICEQFLEEETAFPPAANRKNSGKQRDTVKQGEDGVIRKHMLISGTVTAVGFRYRATYIAQGLGITGWVRNTWDDRVEMEIQGKPLELDEMMRRLGEQRYIEIRDVEEQQIPVEAAEYEFKVRAT